MGSYDGALFILNRLGKPFGKENIGLYRDDSLAIIKNKSVRLPDKTRKELHKVFEQFGLKITTESNLHMVNFLDVTFDLSTGKYKPYRKPNDDPLYINKHSNHPPSILRQLPTSINKHIDILDGNPQGTSVLVVISPLKAFMEDQVEYLGNVGISAIAVEDKTDPEFVQMIKNGVFMVVYCSPECALSTTTWKEIFNDSCFREKLVGVAVDEAHCIPQ